jgi:serine protease AprX
MLAQSMIRLFGPNLQRVFICFTLLLTLAAALPLAQTRHATPQAQPALLQQVAQHPTSRVGVIVQKLSKDRSVEALVTQLGGVVTKDLHIINAFAAELSPRAVRELAHYAGVRWISLDSPLIETGTQSTCADCINTSHLKNAYIPAIGADKVWNSAPYLQGQGIGVAIIDSGVNGQKADFGSRIVKTVKFSPNANYASDGFGHGTHIMGIIGGSGSQSSGTYIGVAPKVDLISIKVSDDTGAGSSSDVVAALQWILDNRATYNIRVVNISLNSAVNESYHTNPINAAVEILWFNGVVVVVSAGNIGKNALFPPANDPFAITVGATNDQGTPSISDDSVASFSGYGTTLDGFQKPDITAPGTNIVSVLASPQVVLAKEHPEAVVKYGKDKAYFRMSGTSMSAPIVAGAIALLLQDEPSLTPDQVKYRLMATATKSGWSYNDKQAGAGYLNIHAAITATTTESSNIGVQASQLLWSGSEPINWNSVNWNSVNWNSVNWNSVNWNSVNWNSTYWGN